MAANGPAGCYWCNEVVERRERRHYINDLAEAGPAAGTGEFFCGPQPFSVVIS